MGRTPGQKDRGRCSNHNVEDGSCWTQKDWKTETEVERCCTEKGRGTKKERTERRTTRPNNLENEDSDVPTSNREKKKGEDL